MPALHAFGTKWKIGSDDLVFPFFWSLLMRFVWIIIIGLVLVFFADNQGCKEINLLKIYLCVLIVLHGAMGAIEFSGLCISAKGTIGNPRPRRHMNVILYLLTFVFLLVVVWDVMGFIWAFDPEVDCNISHTLLTFTRLLLVWNTITTFGVTCFMFFRIGICRMCCVPKKMKYEELAPSESYGGRRLSRISSASLKRHLQRRRWQWRLQNVLCCMKLRQFQRSIFSEVAITLADVFRKLRGYVPSDIAAGMVLLAMDCSTKEDEWINLGTETNKGCSLELTKKTDRTIIKRLSHYFKYACAIYGYPCYIKSSPFLGRIKLYTSCCCCKNSTKEGDMQLYVTGDNRCGWNMVAVMNTTGLKMRDIIYAQFQPEVYLPAFFIAVDNKEKAIVLSIRGSKSLSDLLTDLASQPELVSAPNVNEFYAHKGCAEAAQALLFKLKAEGILDTISLLYPAYRLVVTGHSLGAGIAVIIAIMLKETYHAVHCYAFSPPGGLLSQNAVTYSRSFVTSTVFGDEMIPRLSLQSVESLTERLLQVIRISNKPKYRIFLEGILVWLGCWKPSFSTKKASSKQALKMAFSTDEGDDLCKGFEHMANEEELLVCGSTDELTGKKLIPQTEREDLFLPGRILHIHKRKEKRCWGLLHSSSYRVTWETQAAFSDIYVNRKMWTHHKTESLTAALSTLKSSAKI